MVLKKRREHLPQTKGQKKRGAVGGDQKKKPKAHNRGKGQSIQEVGWGTKTGKVKEPGSKEKRS